MIAYRFRSMLSGLLECADEELKGKFSSLDSIAELARAVGELELALKSDLGIYEVDFAENTKGISSYQELADKAAQRKENRKMKR